MPITKLDERVANLLGLTDLREKRNTAAGSLSGGMRQLLALGCALVHDPPLLFLDEPTSGLDPVHRQHIWNLLYDLSHAGKTIFVTTHYMDEAERCSHVGYIHMSKLIVSGQPDELKRMPDVNPPGTRRLDVTCDHVTQALQTMRSVRGVRSATVFGQSMHLLVDDAITRTDIEKKLREVGIQSAEIHVIGPSLEDVFVALTAKYGNGNQDEKAA